MPREQHVSSQEVEQLDVALQAFEAAVTQSGISRSPDSESISSAASFNPCEKWKTTRHTVQEVIAALRSIEALFPMAKRAADVVQSLATLLDQICG